MLPRLIVIFFAATAAPKEQKLPAPGYLSPMARSLLAQKMEQHALDMMRLVADVVLLAYKDTELAANQIAEWPGLARPMPGQGDTLNESLPPLFFELQDQLRTRARALAAAAKRKSDGEMSAAFSRVTETCVACHSVYLKGKLAEERRFDKGREERP